MKLTQRELAEQIGIDTTCVFNWEANTSNPDIRYVPAVIRFLGYNPLPEGRTLAEELVRHRTTLGMTQKDAAQEVGVDPGTLAKWERGEREPLGRYLSCVERFLRVGEAEGAQRVG